MTALMAVTRRNYDSRVAMARRLSAPGPSREGLLTGAAGTAGAPGTPPAVPSDPRVGRAVPPAPVRRVHHP